MACVKLCIKLSGTARELCVPVQCRPGGPIKRPDPGWYAVDPLIFEVDGKQPRWVKDLNVIAAVARIESLATPAVGKLLRETVSRSLAEISRGLPEGIRVEFDQR